MSDASLGQDLVCLSRNDVDVVTSIQDCDHTDACDQGKSVHRRHLGRSEHLNDLVEFGKII